MTSPIVDFIKEGIREKQISKEKKHNEYFEKWKQNQYINDVHTDAGFEQMDLNSEVKTKVPIHLSKLYPDYEMREEYLERKKEFQEM